MKIMATVQQGDLLAQILEHSNGSYQLKWDDHEEWFAQFEEALLRLAVLIRCDRVGGGIFTLDTNDFCKAADQFLISNVN